MGCHMAMVLKVWSLGHQDWLPNLGTCWKWEFSGPIPNPLNQELWGKVLGTVVLTSPPALLPHPHV